MSDDERRAAAIGLEQALQDWRNAKPRSAAEQRAARMLAYQAAVLLRALGHVNV